MAKIALRFTRSHGPFNAGEVAALEEAPALALIAKGAAEKHVRQPKTETDIATLSVNLDFAELPAFKEALAEIERATADLESRAAELDAREAELSDRETELALREAEQAADWSPIEGSDEEVAGASGAEVAEETGLPKQGK